MAAVIDCTVDLAADQKGVHMSRFPEPSRRRSRTSSSARRCSWSVLAEHIMSRVVERKALKAEVWIRAQWPIHRRTPVTDLATQEMVTLCGIAAASETGTRRVVGVEATGINACPCEGLVRTSASEASRPATSSARSTGSRPSCRRDPQPTRAGLALRRHRARPRRRAARRHRGGLDERADLRPAQAADELFVVEHAHLQPRFVEDSVRYFAWDALDGTLTGLDEDDFLLARQVNYETPNRHDVVADSFGTVGELRRARTGAPSEHQTTLAAWLD